MKNGYIILVGAMFFGYFIYDQFLKSKNVMFSIVGKLTPNIQDFINSGFQNLPISTNIKIFNPLDFGAKISTINIGLYYNENFITSITRVQNFDLQPNQATIIPVTFNVDVLNLAGSVVKLIDAIKNNVPGVNITAKGFVQSNFGRLQINERLVI